MTKLRPLKPKAGAAIVVCVASVAAVWTWQSWQESRRAELREKVIVAFASGDWQSAVASCQQWTAAAPDSGEAWTRYANALAMTQNYEDALDALGRVPKDFDGIVEVRETRLNLLIRDLKRPFECRTECEALLDDEPKNATALGLLVYIDAMLLDIPALRNSLRRAVRASVETPDHYVYLMMLDNFALINGADVTAEWLQQEPDNKTLAFANAAHRVSRRRLSIIKDASEANRTALQNAIDHRDQLAMEHPEADVLLRSILLSAMTEGEIDVLRKHLPLADESFHDETAYLRATAFVQLAEGNLNGAQKAIQHSLTRNPLSFDARALLSDVLRRSGDRQQATIVQSIAITGTKIRETISGMNSVTDANPALLRRIANYARECEDWEVAAALERRLPMVEVQ